MESGDRSRFAVTYQLIDDYQGPWLLGNFYYWICGNCVGNPQEIISLREVLASLQYLVKDRGKRFDSTLCELDARDLFLNLDGALGQNTQAPSKAVSLPEDFGKFDLHISLEMFSGWRIYLVDCSETSRLLVGMPNSKLIHEY